MIQKTPIGFRRYEKATWCEMFLSEMEHIVPCWELDALA